MFIVINILTIAIIELSIYINEYHDATIYEYSCKQLRFQALLVSIVGWQPTSKLLAGMLRLCFFLHKMLLVTITLMAHLGHLLLLISISLRDAS